MLDPLYIQTKNILLLHSSFTQQNTKKKYTQIIQYIIYLHYYYNIIISNSKAFQAQINNIF